MTVQSEPFASGFDRQFIDSTHPLYVSPASTDPVDVGSTGSVDFEPASDTLIARGRHEPELGPWGRALLYGFCGLILTYFAVGLFVGTY